MYIVLQGQFRVSMAAGGGTGLARLHVGEVIGEISFVDSRPPTATVTAVEDAVVLAIPRQRLFAKLPEDTGFAARFYQALSIFLAWRLATTSSRRLFSPLPHYFSLLLCYDKLFCEHGLARAPLWRDIRQHIDVPSSHGQQLVGCCPPQDDSHL